jgi:hypothetical protein
MSDYYLSGGLSETGENIVLNAPWEHKVSELRCLCVVDDKENQKFKVLNSKSISGSGGVYTIVYPFSKPGLSWKAYLWRETTRNGTVFYDGSRIPVEAMLSKIAELSSKADEAKVLLDRVMMFPEDADGKMFLPPANVRKGEVLGFDKDGNPTVGEYCEQVKELMKAKEACSNAVKQAGSYAQQAEQSASLAGQHSFDANESMANAAILADEAKKHALAAEARLQKVKDEGAKAVATITGLEGEAKQHAGNAEASANRAEAAAGSINVKAEEFNKAVCYVGCAVKRVEKQEESVNATVETAKQELNEKAEQTKQEIGAFTDVYTKAETYSKSQIDGVATGAEVVLKMNEIIAQLKDYEEVTGEKLPWELWEAVMAEFQRWQMNPNEVKNWSNGQNPYYSTPPSQKCVVDFNVTNASGAYSGYLYSFAPSTSAIVYLPGCTYANYAHSSSSGSVVAIYAVATSTSGLFRNSNCESVFYAPNSTSVDSIYINAKKAPKVVWAPKGEVWSYAFQASVVDMFVDMRSARVATAAFRNSKMSAESISKTLDSLPTWTDGASHVITFAGSPGAAYISTTETITVEVNGTTYTFGNFPRFTMDDENETLRYSVARATAKGWTVQMGDPQ